MILRVGRNHLWHEADIEQHVGSHSLVGLLLPSLGALPNPGHKADWDAGDVLERKQILVAR